MLDVLGHPIHRVRIDMTAARKHLLATCGETPSYQRYSRLLEKIFDATEQEPFLWGPVNHAGEIEISTDPDDSEPLATLTLPAGVIQETRLHGAYPRPDSRLADNVKAYPFKDGSGYTIVGFWEDVGTDTIAHARQKDHAEALVKAWKKQ